MSRKTRKLLSNIKKFGKLSKRLNQCQTKKCKQYIDQSNILRQEIYKAAGWNNKQTKLNLKKRDTKKLNKYERLERINNKKIEECVLTYCKKDSLAIKKLIKNLKDI